MDTTDTSPNPQNQRNWDNIIFSSGIIFVLSFIVGLFNLLLGFIPALFLIIWLSKSLNKERSARAKKKAAFFMGITWPGCGFSFLLWVAGMLVAGIFMMLTTPSEAVVPVYIPTSTSCEDKAFQNYTGAWNQTCYNYGYTAGCNLSFGDKAVLDSNYEIALAYCT
ncbi:MAG TPA: hypothetical protein ENI23_01325 [bacterium]|nr:hypothetical protein [bacterium]